ncbi:hypothetical protein QNM97_13825 [Gordonia sp. L191]|uniref:hypothetical protein n=1 Tax=Gordonia sp. L191 TaxID=2982699 RepID=UPI0024BF9A09|nr:hypothetical protein [Gordonia sp. L191]WHU45130.1 hypothetical protein QNM97_13825 [Gordonia sp. L191]
MIRRAVAIIGGIILAVAVLSACDDSHSATLCEKKSDHTRVGQNLCKGDDDAYAWVFVTGSIPNLGSTVSNGQPTANPNNVISDDEDEEQGANNVAPEEEEPAPAVVDDDE